MNKKSQQSTIDKNREKIRLLRDQQLLKKEEKINNFSESELNQELKMKNLSTQGSKQEKMSRLKKFLGIQYGKQNSPQYIQKTEPDTTADCSQNGTFDNNITNQVTDRGQSHSVYSNNNIPNEQERSSSIKQRYQQQQEIAQISITPLQRARHEKSKSKERQQSKSPSSSKQNNFLINQNPSHINYTTTSAFNIQNQKGDETPGNQESKKKKAQPRSSVVENIEKMKQKREERRQKMDQIKLDKAKQEAHNQANGKNGDVDFENMIQEHRYQQGLYQHHTPSNLYKLCVIVRKRPIFPKEQLEGEIDSVSCSNPLIRIHAPKVKVDGITKYIDNFDFTFDNTFNGDEDTDIVYEYSLKPVIDTILNNGVVTCFAYGQTGSGKTYTMKGLQEKYAKQIYKDIQQQRYPINVFISFYEIYGGKCLDLLNNRENCVVLEDKNNNVQIQNLTEKISRSSEEMLNIIEVANNVRTTHATTSNDESSRSHAICQIVFKSYDGREVGKLILVDLAGSERAQDCQNNDKQRRIEGAEINKSLLSLKECIRALDQKAAHIPFRGSKLTLILRDSFQSKLKNSKVIMIACVSPGSSSAEHTLNTLRYADRLKDNKQPAIKKQMLQGQENTTIQNNHYEENSKKKTLLRFPIDENVQKENEYTNIYSENNYKIQKQSPRQQQSSPYTGKQINKDYNPLIYQSLKNSFNSKQQDSKQQQQQSQEKKSKQKSTNPIQKEPQMKNNYIQDIKALKNSQKANQLQNKTTTTPNNNKNNNILKGNILNNNSNKNYNPLFDNSTDNVEDQYEQIFNQHITTIKLDAKLLNTESELVGKLQNDGMEGNQLKNYVSNLEYLIKEKINMYSNLYNQIMEAKQNDQAKPEFIK